MQRTIYVYADWDLLAEPTHVGTLKTNLSRGKEIFTFDYERDWLKHHAYCSLDPLLQLFAGPQYPPIGQNNFGVFLDSAPDRWGRLLMNRKEALLAKLEHRKSNLLFESDYLLGVYDGARIGALRFKLNPNGPFLDDNVLFASPPWAALRDLEYASLELEKDNVTDNPNYDKWLQMLVAPGSSLGGARPKASVLDKKDQLWIAKFPSSYDTNNIGAWEWVVHILAKNAGINIPQVLIQRFNSRHHSFLSKRFDRNEVGKRIHFASAMTLLQQTDGADANSGVSYLELAEFIIAQGAKPNQDLEELWRRIVFYICVSNVDDHLRNHGFILDPNHGWLLSPAYDINPVATSNGLKLNINENDNSQDLELALQVAPYFRLTNGQAKLIIQKIIQVVKRWPEIATSVGITTHEQEYMARAFRVADSYYTKVS